MDSFQIRQALKRLVKRYASPKVVIHHHILAWDQIADVPELVLSEVKSKEEPHRAYFLICNTAVIASSGEHWVVIHIPLSGPPV